MKLTELSDAQLIDSLKNVCAHGRAVLARLLAHLVEIEERRLHLEAACSSMLDFCVGRLGMSEDEACRRIAAARLARRFPDLLQRIERGEIHLSTVLLLRDHLSEQSYEEIVSAVAGKTKREVEAVLARRAPKPDVVSAIVPIQMQTVLPVAPAACSPSKQIAQLSEARHKVQFTAGDELRQKLERAADLMRHRNPSGDLAEVVERGIDLLIEKLEKERLGKSEQPHKTPRSVKAGRISQAVRRAVFERDGERCTFIDDCGNRCSATTLLELDHIHARALGGADTVDNLRVRCRAHNRLHAEHTFGREHVERHIHPRQRGSEPANMQTAASGLLNLGFRTVEVRRAVDELTRRHGDSLAALRVDLVLREALGVLRP